MAKEREEQPSDQTTASVFEVVKIKELIEMMQEGELFEIDLREGDQRIRLRRGGQPVQTGSAAAPMLAASTPTTGFSQEPSPAAAVDDPTVTINSPTIGTFYSRPKPDATDFVKVGDMVTPETIVCLVEAMKMFNEIPAGISGKITQVLAKNEDPVDNNKPLFRVLPS